MARAALLILGPLTKSSQCVQSLAKLSCLDGIRQSMKARPDLLPEAVSALKAMFNGAPSGLVEQAIQCHLIEELLAFLNSPLRDVENSASLKAQIVQTLKSMSFDLQFGEKVSQILDNSPIWAEFKHQKHDLFLAPANNTGYLTAGAGVAGYLTQGFQSQQIHTVPPST